MWGGNDLFYLRVSSLDAISVAGCARDKYDFTVQLPKRIALGGAGQWYVGLAHIMYPNEFYIDQPTELLTVKYGKKIGNGDYSMASVIGRNVCTVYDFARLVNASPMYQHFTCHVSADRVVSLMWKHTSEPYLQVTCYLAHLLGETAFDLTLVKTTPIVYIRKHTDGSTVSFKSPECMREKDPHVMLVYSDIVEEHQTGGGLHPVLKIVPVEYNDQGAAGQRGGRVTVQEFQQVQFHKVAYTHLSRLRFVLKDASGRAIPFRQDDPSTAVEYQLIFKRVPDAAAATH